MKFCTLVFLGYFFSCLAYAAGNPNAPLGGEFRINIGTAPTTLNALTSTDVNSRFVQDKIIEGLLDRDVNTREWVPSLATSYEISKDGKSFDFTIRQGVKWHDGKPLTVEDVKFSFDAIVEPTNKYKTAHLKSYYENIKSAEIIAPNKIRFTVSKPYFDNFSSVAGLPIIPIHLYKDPTKDQEKLLNKTLVGTGPYQLVDFDRAKGIILKQNKDWWGRKEPSLKGIHNFETLSLKFIEEDVVAIQRLEKGDVDYHVLGVEDFMKKTSGPKWGKEVIKVKTLNKDVRPYGFVAFNLTSPIFSGKKTREAMVHLFNRREMIKKFFFDMSLPATGPLYQQSEYANPSVLPLEFDPKLALKLLKEDGWKIEGQDKFLSKMVNGKKINLSFTILEPDAQFVKFLTVFKEDAKQAGVDVNIKVIEWNSFIKLLDERKFEAVRLGWGNGELDWDPKQIWHSDSIANAGSNFVSYKNAQVDKLIDEARVTMDKKERVKKLREVYKIIAEDVPYIFLFNSKFSYYAHRKNIAKEKDSYVYKIGPQYWWMTK